MARPRAFDTDRALDGAMETFWAEGYAEASLPDLLGGMGITRGSLYKAFKDKKTLFLEVLARYDASVVSPAVAVLEGDTIADGTGRIMAVFGTIADAVRDGDRRGCLLCTTAAGPAAEDKDIARAVHTMLARMRGAFLAALRAATPPHPEALDAAADLLVTQYVGLRVLSRSNAPVEQIDAAIGSLAVVLPAIAVLPD